jgi:hypothetical protein
MPIRGVEEIDLGASLAWVRHRKMAKTGGRLVLTAGIVAAAVPLGVVGTCAVTGFDSACGVFLLGGVFVETVAGVTVVTGEVMLFAGGISAAYDARKLGYDTNPSLGWIGLGLFTAGTVTVFAAAVSQTEQSIYVGLAGVGGILGGTVLGYVQHAQNDTQHLSFRVVPTLNGFALAGQF